MPEGTLPEHADPPTVIPVLPMRMRALTALLLVVVIAPVTIARPGPGSIDRLDVVVRDGRVLDGSGNPWFHADVGIAGGEIVAVGDLADAVAERVVDASGKVVVPGFVDIHSHADEGEVSLSDPDVAAAANLVTQGITTVVVGQDGRCRCPVGEAAERYRSQGVGPNVVQLVGHGTIRDEVIGDDDRPSTAVEAERMEDLVRRGMEAGAAGLSTGLEYTPGRSADTEEVIALARVAAEYGGFYISHQRSEGRTPMWWLPSTGGDPPDLFDAIRETITIGDATGMPVVASHIKVKGSDFWGAAPAITRLIEEARDRRIQVYADQYPYETTGSDGNTVLIPRWVRKPLDGEVAEAEQELRRAAFDGDDAAREELFSRFRDRLRQRLQDAGEAEAIRADIAHEIERRGGAERLLVLESHREDYTGEVLAELARRRGEDPVDVALYLELHGLDRPGGARIRGFSLHDVDVRHYMGREYTATCTDAGIARPGDGWPHPRFYGTYPRKLSRYARDGDVLSVAQAVRSSTSLPARIVGLRRRGRLREGDAADVVVLDLDALQDRATAMEPHRYSTGVETVLINGVFAVAEGEPNGALAGKVLDRRDRKEFVER